MAKKPPETMVFSTRLVGTTSGRILLMLCRGRRTVAELASALRITDNAVRAQLERLGSEGLIHQAGSRKGVRKPHADYQLTEKGYRLFPTAYEPALAQLIKVMAQRLPNRLRRSLLLEVGRHLLTERFGELRGNPRERLAAIVRHLNDSAGRIDVAQNANRIVLRSCSCPLASVTAHHAEICALVAQLLGELTGAEVREQCIKGDLPQCCFECAIDRSA